jgi:membrane protease YdiL (CAAX protease family)
MGAPSETDTMGATGFQILFLYFAALFGAMLAGRHASSALALPPEYFDALCQVITFVIAGLALLLVPALRRQSLALLASPVPRPRWAEVAFATLLKLAVPFGLVGALALPAILGPDAGALSRIPVQPDPERQLAFELRPVMLAHTVIFVCIVGPLLEEIYFRGFLYRAWERQCGWLPAALLTSAAFAIGHPSHIVSSFLASLIFIGLCRRTGSLRAAIYAHGGYNLLVFWPLFGHLVFAPRPGDPLAWSTWSVEIASLLVIALGVPLYLFLARKPFEASTSPS